MASFLKLPEDFRYEVLIEGQQRPVERPSFWTRARELGLMILSHLAVFLLGIMIYRRFDVATAQLMQETQSQSMPLNVWSE